MTATKTARDRQRRIHAELAATRARAARQRRRQRFVVGGSVGGVAAVVAVLALVAALGGGGHAARPGTAPQPVSPAVLAQVTGVPASTLDAIGAGSVSSVPRRVNEPALTSDGKPLVLYVGADYCPFCASERWALVQALSRFGTWQSLSTTRSAANDVHPNTATFTFHGARYTSDYVAFDGRELYTNVAKGRGYTRLDTLTPEQGRLFNRYAGGFPFIDLGGHYVQPGVSFNPSVLDGLEWEQIAAGMADPRSSLARSVDGAANVLTATICEATGQQPSSVCTAPGVTTAKERLRG